MLGGRHAAQLRDEKLRSDSTSLPMPVFWVGIDGIYMLYKSRIGHRFLSTNMIVCLIILPTGWLNKWQIWSFKSIWAFKIITATNFKNLSFLPVDIVWTMWRGLSLLLAEHQDVPPKSTVFAFLNYTYQTRSSLTFSNHFLSLSYLHVRKAGCVQWNLGLCDIFQVLFEPKFIPKLNWNVFALNIFLPPSIWHLNAVTFAKFLSYSYTNLFWGTLFILWKDIYFSHEKWMKSMLHITLFLTQNSN